MNALTALRRTRPPTAGVLSLLLVGALAGALAAGCSASHDRTGSSGSGSGKAAAADAGGTLMAHGMPMSAADMGAAWDARPAFVDAAGSTTSAAYAYALTRPDVLQYLPCYCGCIAMHHRSNLDCFLRPRQAGMSISFEEHASYCDVCVDTALMAKRMVADGASFADIRAAVDREYGATGVPGTETDLPPS